MLNNTLPVVTPDKVIEWYNSASGYFACINLDQLNRDATLQEVQEAYENDLSSLTSISVDISHLVSSGWWGCFDEYKQ